MTLRVGFGVSFLLSLAAGVSPALAQSTQAPAPGAPSAAPTSNSLPPIGATIGLEVAKKAAAAASAEAQKNKWLMAIAIVDPAGTLVYYEKADNTQNGSAIVAIDKARSAALYKRPTKAFQDAVEKGGVGLRVLRLEGSIPLDGGVPLLVDGKLIGALGVSGDLAEND